ncbi:MAG: class II aldolase/adducin family protein [Spirochaetia bacterium]
MIEEFISLCHAIGCQPCYIQGGGGNISLKIDEKSMIIKASGGMLKDVSFQRGFSIVDHQQIATLLRSGCDENVFLKNTENFMIGNYPRPSMELGFHAVLKRCVIHTHSVYANLLTCAQEGYDIVKKLFPMAKWIRYQTPGYPLSRIIAEKADEYDILFLENHGLIVCADKSNVALELHQKINDNIHDYFLPSLASFDNFSFEEEEESMNSQILFPDQVIYAYSKTDLKNTQAQKETIKAYHFIKENIKRLGLTPKTIDDKEVNILLNLESEKYRQKQVL